jgi:predicted PurR-regulated permease PerM
MSETPQVRRELVRSTLSVLTILALIAGSFWILKPFLPALLWASSIVVATWPLFLALERRLRGKRWLAVTVITLVLLLVLLVPMAMALGSIVTHADQIAAWAGTLQDRALPPPPGWVEKLPMVGEKVAALWRETAASGSQGLLARLAPYADDVVAWMVAKIGGVGVLFVQFLLTVLVSALLYAKGEAAAGQVIAVARRLAGEQGAGAVTLMAQTVRGVALGIVVTALAQALLGGIGLAIAGVPSAAVLTAVMLVFGIAQLGPMPVLIPAIVWLYARGESGWGTALLVWSLLVGTFDNVVRPMLIKRGADLPFVLIFVGVLGGLISLGVVGLFVGPVILAVAYKLLEAWVAEGESVPEPPRAA